jgi:hypothetical protein
MIRLGRPLASTWQQQMAAPLSSPSLSSTPNVTVATARYASTSSSTPSLPLSTLTGITLLVTTVTNAWLTD